MPVIIKPEIAALMRVWLHLRNNTNLASGTRHWDGYYDAMVLVDNLMFDICYPRFVSPWTPETTIYDTVCTV